MLRTDIGKYRVPEGMGDRLGSGYSGDVAVEKIESRERPASQPEKQIVTTRKQP